ncbi:MAG: cold-shock protein, partial [Rhodobacteraceae bacterium]|nr:cold-shock protein [Paracoccaceae bacterium]
ANVLRNFGQSSVADGSEVEVFVQETERGVQVVSIISVEPPTDVAVSVLDDIAGFDPGYLADLEILPARVKWFDKGKGFGFANIFGLADDVFIHIEVLRKSGLADLLPGEAVCLRVIDGKRGKMAAEVMPWDVAQKQKSDGD